MARDELSNSIQTQLDSWQLQFKCAMQHGSLDKDKITNNGEGFIAEFPKDTVLYYCCHTSDLYYDKKKVGYEIGSSRFVWGFFLQLQPS